MFLNTLGNFGEKFPGKKIKFFKNSKLYQQVVLKERAKGKIEEKKTK